jgi:hypothetical protein
MPRSPAPVRRCMARFQPRRLCRAMRPCWRNRCRRSGGRRRRARGRAGGARPEGCRRVPRLLRAHRVGPRSRGARRLAGGRPHHLFHRR